MTARLSHRWAGWVYGVVEVRSQRKAPGVDDGVHDCAAVGFCHESICLRDTTILPLMEIEQV